MNPRAQTLFYQWCEFHCGLPMAHLAPEPVDGMRVIDALWPLVEDFRPNHSEFRAQPYNAAFEAQADAAIERFLASGRWGLVSIETWRVLLERYQQAVLIAATNEAAGNPLMSVPTILPDAALQGAAMLWLLHSMKLPFPASDRSHEKLPARIP